MTDQYDFTRYFNIYDSDEVKRSIIDLTRSKIGKNLILAGYNRTKSLSAKTLKFIEMNELKPEMFQTHLIVALVSSVQVEHYFMSKYVMIFDVPGLLVLTSRSDYCLISFPPDKIILAKLATDNEIYLEMIGNALAKTFTAGERYRDAYNTFSARAGIIDYLRYLEDCGYRVKSEYWFSKD